MAISVSRPDVNFSVPSEHDSEQSAWFSLQESTNPLCEKDSRKARRASEIHSPRDSLVFDGIYRDSFSTAAAE